MGNARSSRWQLASQRLLDITFAVRRKALLFTTLSTAALFFPRPRCAAEVIRNRENLCCDVAATSAMVPMDSAVRSFCRDCFRLPLPS